MVQRERAGSGPTISHDSVAGSMPSLAATYLFQLTTQGSAALSLGNEPPSGDVRGILVDQSAA